MPNYPGWYSKTFQTSSNQSHGGFVWGLWLGILQDGVVLRGTEQKVNASVVCSLFVSSDRDLLKSRKRHKYDCCFFF